MASIPPISIPQTPRANAPVVGPGGPSVELAAFGGSLQLLVDAAQANTRLLGEIQQSVMFASTTVSGVQQAITASTALLSSIQHTLSTVFPQGSTLTATATAGSAVLPATPAKFMTVQATDGNAYKVALYLP